MSGNKFSAVAIFTSAFLVNYCSQTVSVYTSSTSCYTSCTFLSPFLCNSCACSYFVCEIIGNFLFYRKTEHFYIFK